MEPSSKETYVHPCPGGTAGTHVRPPVHPPPLDEEEAEVDDDDNVVVDGAPLVDDDPFAPPVAPPLELSEMSPWVLSPQSASAAARTKEAAKGSPGCRGRSMDWRD
jgi:hypothetical protein